MCLSWRGVTDTQSIISLNSTQTCFLWQQTPQQQCFSFFKSTETEVAGYWCHQSGAVAVVLYVGLAMRPSDVSQQSTWAYRDGEDGIIYLIVNYLSLI